MILKNYARKNLYLLIVVLFFALALVAEIRTKQDIKCPDCNVVLISIDTLRADHLGTYGYEKNTSPNIDKFANSSILFEKAYSAAPWTLPSHSSLFTSLPSSKLGIKSPTDKLDDKELTLAEILKSNGYKTQGISVGGPFVHPSYGLAQGFDNFYKNQTISGVKAWNDAEITFDMGSKWIRENSKDKFFLFLHTFQVHDPYGDHESSSDVIDIDTLIPFAQRKNVTEEEQKRFVQAAIEKYDSDVTYTDRQIQKVFDQIKASGIENKTIVIILADHGEEFGEHNLVGFHLVSIYDELLHVPLILKIPNIKAARISQNVSLLDIVPTLMDLTLKKSDLPSHNFAGESILGVLKGETRNNQYVISQTAIGDKDTVLKALQAAYKIMNTPEAVKNQRDAVLKWASQFPAQNPVLTTAIRKNNWKYIEYPNKQPELFNLEKDPFEKNNLINDAQNKSILEELKSAVQEFNRKFPS